MLFLVCFWWILPVLQDGVVILGGKGVTSEARQMAVGRWLPCFLGLTFEVWPSKRKGYKRAFREDK